MNRNVRINSVLFFCLRFSVCFCVSVAMTAMVAGDGRHNSKCDLQTAKKSCNTEVDAQCGCSVQAVDRKREAER
jgi:hypothetical protein